MFRSRISVLLLVLLLSGFGLTACEPDEPPATPPPATATAVSNPNPDPTATAEPANQSDGVFFSELLPGVPGGNSHEFIELYNAGSEPVDLMGWSIFYLLGEGQEQELVFFFF